MTTLERVLDRSGFESVDLDIDSDEAHSYIDAAIKGLSASQSDDGVKYRTTDGKLLAIVAPRPTGSGDVQSRLAYRTEPKSELATGKAAKILKALEQHTIDR